MDDDEVLLPVVKFGVTVVKNVPVRSKSRMVPSVKPAITKHPDDVAVIDVHSSLMGNDVESPRNDFDVDGIFSHKLPNVLPNFVRYVVYRIRFLLCDFFDSSEYESSI